MTGMTIAKVKDFLESRDNFVILTHCRPDGDTLGSSAALCRGLRQRGKNAWVLENPEITPKHAQLHQDLTKQTVLDSDTLVCVDVASKEMLPEVFLPLVDRISLRIDHHKTASVFTPMQWVESSAAACGQMIYDLLMALGVELDVPMANALYTAISTDTGCFRFANTQPHSFEVAAACARVTPDIYELNQHLFENTSLARLKVQGWMLENMRRSADGQVAVCALPRSVEQSCGATEDDLENISGFPRSIEGVKIAATLRETADGFVKMSVRAVPGYDAGAVCAKFGGGGHKGAAGATVQMSLEQAAEKVAKALEETLG